MLSACGPEGPRAEVIVMILTGFFDERAETLPSL